MLVVRVSVMGMFAELNALFVDVVEGASVMVECVLRVCLSIGDWLDVEICESVMDGVDVREDDSSDGVVVEPLCWVVVAVCGDLV